jgi:polyhydroxyalkanoate synthase
MRVKGQTAPRARKPAGPDRRLAPRPLPAHLAAAMLLWTSSRAAWPLLSSVSRPSSPEGTRIGQLAGEIADLGPERFGAALDAELASRSRAFIAGLEAYRRHPLRRPVAHMPVIWREGTTRLLDYSAGIDGPAVLVVPSLINRFYVLDLRRGRSFLRHLAAQGVRPLVVDWAAPGAVERGFALDDYVARLDRALGFATGTTGAPVGVLGYCMGGLLALALALRRPRHAAGLTLLATPWDFHAERPAQAQLLALAAGVFPGFCGAAGTLPVSAIQTLFLALDPFLAERKFARFAELDPDSDAAQSFVALEDWINDGVPLAVGVAVECLKSWYGDNLPGRGLWRVVGTRVQPGHLSCPTLVVVPSRDRIVPPASAAALAEALPGATVLRPPLGHIGMMAAAGAPAMLWDPISEWLRASLDSAERGLLQS